MSSIRKIIAIAADVPPMAINASELRPLETGLGVGVGWVVGDAVGCGVGDAVGCGVGVAVGLGVITGA